MSDVVELDSRSKALPGLPETAPNTTYQNLFLHLHPDNRRLAEEAIKRLLETQHYSSLFTGLRDLNPRLRDLP
jgi:hypothetical protein